jgi:Nop14-like family
MEREKGDNIRRELDQEFDSVRGLLYSGDPSSEDNIVPEATGRDENYDQLVRELAFDKRAIPKDRTKTEEELASEAKEALENAERRRLERMIGEDEGEEEDGRLGPGLGGGSDVDGEDSDYEVEQPEDLVAATRMKDRISKMPSKELIAFAESFIKRLVLMHKNLKRGLSQIALNKTTNTWPDLADLQFLQSIGTIWSTSDLNHRVVSPTRILMGAYLALGRVRSLGDIACGLFLCTLFLQFETLSKRLVPEAVNFLANTILHLAPHGFRDPTSIPGSFPSPDFRSDLCRPLSMDVKKSRDLSAHKPNIKAILSRGDVDEQTKVDLLGLSLDLLVRFADMYKSLEGFLELFEPLSAMLHNIHTKKLSPSLQASKFHVKTEIFIDVMSYRLQLRSL